MISGRCRLRHRASQITEPTALPQLTTRRSLTSPGAQSYPVWPGVLPPAEFTLAGAGGWPGRVRLDISGDPGIVEALFSGVPPRPVTVQHVEEADGGGCRDRLLRWAGASVHRPDPGRAHHAALRRGGPHDPALRR